MSQGLEWIPLVVSLLDFLSDVHPFINNAKKYFLYNNSGQWVVKVLLNNMKTSH